MQSFTTYFTNFDTRYLQRINVKEYSPPKQNKQFKFKGKHLFVLLLIAIGIAFGFKIFLPPDPDFTVETAKELAQKIYEAGKVGESLKDLPLDAAMVKKLTDEIEGILSKETDCDSCEVYFLTAVVSGIYPILGYGNAVTGGVFLNVGEPWKVGMTCKCEKKRYPNDYFYKNDVLSIKLSKQKLKYVTVFRGSYKQCLIMEKVLIYTYSLWSGHPELLKPPGCKIFR